MKRRGDTMRSARIEGTEARAHFHGVRLVQRASCETPKGQTITLEEWKAQQAAQESPPPSQAA